MNPAVEYLLREVSNPVVRSAFIVALPQGGLRNLPDELCVPALLLHAVGHEFNAEDVLEDALEISKRVRNWIAHKNPVFEEYLLRSTVFQGLPLTGRSDTAWVVNAYKELTGAFTQ